MKASARKNTSGWRDRTSLISHSQNGLEQLRMGAVVGAVLGDVDRDVTEDADAARGRVGAKRAPLALEPDLVVERRRRA